MDRRRMWIAAMGVCLLLSVFFAGFWKNWFVLPVLGMLNTVGKSVSFPILEYAGIGVGLWILAGLFHGVGWAVKRASRTGLTIFLMFLLLWLPLFGQEAVLYSADADQMRRCASVLIDELNSSAPDFTVLPDDLPAKFVDFPFWMRRLGISGFYSFFTGEALVSPIQPAYSIPFVAVHEAIHGQGIADEGLCNIAAYEECMERGGLYAGSAQLWALRYVMGQLRSMDYAAYANCMQQMSAHTHRLYMQIGGAYESGRKGVVQEVSSLILPASDYEILAHWLAVQISE